MAVIKNKEVLQSYIITAAKYDFSIYEKRILYRQIEIEQELLQGQKARKGVIIETNLWKDKKYTIPVKWLLKDEEDKNHYQIRKAFKALMSKIIEYDTREVSGAFPLIQRFELNKRSEYVTWQVPHEIVDVIVNFAHGFRKYELKTAMEFESIYSMRFYELMSGKEEPITFGIDKLKEMFRLENKYKQVNDFLRFVIIPAKKELDEKSPYSFEYAINKEGRKYKSITFYPIKIAKNIDDDVRLNSVIKGLSIRYAIPKEVEEYMMNNFGITTKELKQHYKLLEAANKSLDLLGLLTEKKRYIADARSPMGYIVAMLRERISIEEDEEPIEEPKEGTYREPTEEEQREAAAAIAELSARTGIDFSRP
jgi:hypothetical protein